MIALVWAGQFALMDGFACCRCSGRSAMVRVARTCGWGTCRCDGVRLERCLGGYRRSGRSKGPADMSRCGLAVGVGLVLVMAGCGSSKVSSSARVSSLATPSASSSTAATPASTTTTTSPASTQTTPAVVIPAGGPVPAGFAPSSFTAIGEQTWWLLGNAPCASAPCTSIVRTTNGGVSFVGIPAPRAPYDPPGSSQTTGVWQLRFADAVDGFAYDTSLYVTHRGGSSCIR